MIAAMPRQAVHAVAVGSGVAPDRARVGVSPYDGDARGYIDRPDLLRLLHPTTMRIDVRDPETRRRRGRTDVDPVVRPPRARIEDDEPPEVFLNWEAALDDAGRLRSCIVCGCRDIYKVRMFPQLTGFVVVLAFAGAAVGIFGREGVATNPLVLAALVGVLALDVASLVFSRYRLVCYRCRSRYSQVEIARHHKPWDRTLAARYEAPSGRRGDLPAVSESPRGSAAEGPAHARG